MIFLTFKAGGGPTMYYFCMVTIFFPVWLLYPSIISKQLIAGCFPIITYQNQNFKVNVSNSTGKMHLAAKISGLNSIGSGIFASVFQL